ncbi:hypothetical protein M0R04_00075 [Candidatus Dojkabacteria bacterium]|jgi:hypothetical protein|nr:hypothetical protein [Candidatus Dojkabacteria bacterium]
MKITFKLVWLLFITVLFVGIGSGIIYVSIDRVINNGVCRFNKVSYDSGTEVIGYKSGELCNCEDGSIVCSKLNGGIDTSNGSKFTKSNLVFSAKYSKPSSSSIEVMPLKTNFVSISILDNSTNIVLEQEQLCSHDNRAPIQIGRYMFNENILTVSNSVNTSPNLYATSCIVTMNFKISKIKLKEISDLKIVYANDLGQTVPATLCYYNNTVFANEDVYSSIDNCNICKCENGVSKCSNDRVCD